jgi:hypothetical protein
VPWTPWGRTWRRAWPRARGGLAPARRVRPKSRPGGRGLTGSLHRAEGEGDLTEQAREELERKVRELDEEEGDCRP